MDLSTKISEAPVQRHPYRVAALVALATALFAQLIWTVWQMTGGFRLDVMWRPLAFTIVFVLVAVTRGDMRLANALGRLTISSSFLLALWNRFDNFPGFIRYAGRVLSFMHSLPVSRRRWCITLRRVELRLKKLNRPSKAMWICADSSASTRRFEKAFRRFA